MELEEKLLHLPDHPGVYLMRDRWGKVIYVGKASSLKNRIRSYFRGQHQPRTAVMVSHIADIEYILTGNEVEALILECNLIKEHRPRYNVFLKDDKSYPYIRITTQELYPRIQITRNVVRDGSRYFGPYTNAGSLRETVKLLHRFFPVRNCKSTPLQPRSRPCLNAHIGRCLAPCTGEVDAAVYREAVDKVILFLEGKYSVLVRELKKQMEAAADGMEYERAARLRDQLQAVINVSERQRIAAASGDDADVIALAVDGETALGLVFFSREGKVIGRDHFFLTGTAGKTRGEVMSALLKGYYSRGGEIPPAVYLSDEPDDIETISMWLRGLRDGKVNIKVPKRGKKLKLLEMVRENAASLLEEHVLATRCREEEGEAVLKELQRLLDLPCLPRRMEAYDVSNFQGKEQVGAMSVFADGRPLPSSYRRFSIKTVEGPNDYAAIQEVLARRFKRATDQDPRFSELPDLVLIDGGPGQLRAAREVMKKVGVAAIPTFSLAKEEELLYREDSAKPIRLPRESKALHLLQYLRDEAHRFAVTYHRKKRERGTYRSILDEIPGVGPSRKKELMRYFGSIDKIRQATLDELLAVKGMNRTVAARIMERLGGKKSG